ncbi:MAG: hypothetical protein ACXVUE_01530 [Solirubrobacteraceae bacterium]
MSTLNHRRKIRRVRVLVVGAFVAIRLLVPGAARAQDVSWASQAHGADVATDISAHASSQGVLKSGMVLGGFTSQAWPVVFELAHGGRLVILGATGLNLTCTSGDQFPVEDGWQLLTVAKNGRVNASEQIPAQQGQGDTLTGGSHSLTGRFNRQRTAFRGTWRMQLSFTNTDGSADTCQSGPVTFSLTL